MPCKEKPVTTIRDTFLQSEYGGREAPFIVANSVYDSVFFVAAGFCGLHVMYMFFMQIIRQCSNKTILSCHLNLQNHML